MGSEFREFYSIHPEYKKEEERLLKRVKKRIRTAFWNMRFKKTVPGSEQWHRLQSKISHLSNSNDDRLIRSIFYEKSCKSCKSKPNILKNVTVSFPYRLNLGSNVFINEGTYITARDEITIGDNVLIGPYTVINSGMHNYKNKSELIRNQGHKYGKITIGNDVWIGAHCVIMPGITIDEGAVVGAGAIVTHDVKPYTVVAGTPAKEIGKRE